MANVPARIAVEGEYKSFGPTTMVTCPNPDCLKFFELEGVFLGDTNCHHCEQEITVIITLADQINKT